ncbi:MAG: hypothetical protein ACRDTP_06220, partial [Mycobacteriales bacterium]
VRAELALLAGAPDDAVRDAEAALAEAAAAGAPRHVTKSLLVRGVARAACGDRASAAADLRSALEQAQALGLVPLVWPAALVAARVVPEGAAEMRARAAAAATAIVVDLGDRGPAFAARPEIAALLGEPGPIG